MKRGIVLLLVILFLLPILPRAVHGPRGTDLRGSKETPLVVTPNLSELSAEGSTLDGTVFFSTTITGVQTSVLNSYADIDTHEAMIDIEQFAIPDWDIYRVDVVLENLTAAPERETVGVNGNTWDFKIEKDNFDNIHSQLAQGFYDQPYNGSLQNYSIYYRSAYYDPDVNNPAYLVIRRAYDSDTSNVTSYSVLPYYVSGTWHTEDIRVNLTARDTYYLIIDGEQLIEHEERYPEIEWRTENTAGDFNTYRFMEPSTWVPINNREALLNYTYIPWNQTTNHPLIFTSPANIELQVNSTDVAGNVWTLMEDNPARLNISTNQSVYMNYNLTLWYSQSLSTSTTWSADTSRADIYWNATSETSYPVTTYETSRYLNVTKMPDWAIEGLYNGSSPTNQGGYTDYTTVATCTSMTNGTWTMSFTAPNYVTAIEMSDHSSGQPIVDSVSILVDMDIDTTIEDASSNPAQDGSTNLTIYKSGSSIWRPDNETVVDGTTNYLWDIDNETSDNGLYTLEVYWVNGTEAGYLTTEVVVYYPTELTTPQPEIDYYTNDTFDFTVHFNDTFTPQGLDSSQAEVRYSFDEGPSTLMSDLPDGTWTASVSTAGKAAGTYNLNVTARGYAIENQTLNIPVTLIYNTTALDILWSNGDSITYIENTTLSVGYYFVNGTPVEWATANATDGTTTWDLIYDSASQRYNYTFEGTAAELGIGNFSLEIRAWKAGFQNRSALTVLEIGEEPTVLQFNWKTDTITWTQDTILIVNYTDSTGALIDSAETRQIFINGTEYLLQGDNGTYWFTFDNSLDLGHFEIAVNLSKYGYIIAYDETLTLDIIPEPTTLDVTWTPANLTIEFTGSFNLTVDYTYSAGDVPETGTMVNVTIDGTTYHLSYNGSHWYLTINGSDLGVGNFTATILADCYGYEDALNVTAELIVTTSPNMFDVQYEPSDYIMTYAETLNITVYYLYGGEPVENATVRLYVNSGRIYDLILGMDDLWHISLAASDIGLGNWNLTILANSSGYDTGRDEVLLGVQVDTPVLTPSWSEHDLYYTHETELTVTLMDSLGNPILDAEVNATYRSQNYTLTHEGLGAYTLQLDGSDGLGSFTIAIRSWAYGFDNLTDSVLLNIVETPLENTIEEIYYGFNGSVFVELFYDGEYYVSVDVLDVDSKPVNTLTVNLTIDGKIYPLMSAGGGTYSTTIAGSTIGVGSFTALMQADVYGYESFSESLTIDILPVPTEILFTVEAPPTMFLNDTFDLILNFTDGHTGELSPADEILALFANPVTWTIVSEGVYSFEISTYSLPLTDYLLNITFLKANYTSVSYSTTITVRAVYTALTGNTEYFEWENETIVFAVQFHDLDHDLPVYWASVRVSFSSIELNMTHAGGGIYEVEYRVLLAPNDYDLTFTAEAVGCDSQTLSAELEVRAKTNLYFVFNLPESVAEGSSFSVGATLLVAGTDEPFDGAPVRFYVYVTLDNGTAFVQELNAVTNLQGYASQAFMVPTEAVNLTVVAAFEGTRQVWSVEEQSGTIPVTPGVMTQFLEFITQPPGLYMILAIVLLGVVAGAYNKIHKPRKAHERRALQRQLNAFNDLQTLRHFMAVYLDRGTCVFYHPFTDMRIQPDLISGFIAAITSVYGEIKGDGVSGALEEIQYQGLWLNSYSSQYVIGILILEGETSSFLRERLQFFVEMFENQYESELTDWRGSVDCFDPEWVIGNLNETFNYNWMLPHVIAEGGKARGLESELLRILSARLDEKREFRIADVLEPASEETGKTQAEILDVLLEMQEKGLIRPISVHTVLQRQGLGISGEEEGEIEIIGGEEALESVEEEPARVSETPSDMKAEEPSEQDEVASDEKEPEKHEDEAEKFIKDVEALMSSETDSEDND